MRMERTFSPVGQGAFFTEVFINDENNNKREYFTVVYDCGSLSNLYLPFKTQMDKVISNSSQIDVFFISHLDADHVNGVEYLIDKGWLNNNTTIVLPFYENYQIELLKLVDSRDYSNFFSTLKHKNFKIIYFIPYASDDDSEGDVIDIGNWHAEDNDTSSQSNHGEYAIVKELEGSLLKANTVFRFKEIWEYRPFTMNDSASLDFFRKVEESTVIKPKDIEDIFNNVFKNGLRKNKKLKEIKRIYNSVGSQRSGDTLININSLVVISKAIVPVMRCYTNKITCLWHISLFLPNEKEFKELLKINGEKHSVCVYTGDINLKNDTDFDKFIKKLRNHCSKDISLIQLPHHGSATSYNERLADISLACFANFDTRKKTFDKTLPFEFANKNKLLFLITEDRYSEFYQEVILYCPK